MPTIVVSAVMRIGRMRILPASATASMTLIPFSRSLLAKSTRTMPLFTTIPASMSMPTMAVIERLVPVNSRVRTTPMKAMGTVKMMMNGSRNDSNWLAITMYTSAIAASIAMVR